MKHNTITAHDLEADVKIFRDLAEEYRDKFDEEGWSSLEEASRYYDSLADKLTDLAWHYSCLANEGILER